MKLTILVKYIFICFIFKNFVFDRKIKKNRRDRNRYLESKIRKSGFNEENQKYDSLLIVGDAGQSDPWFKQSIEHKIISKLWRSLDNQKKEYVTQYVKQILLPKIKTIEDENTDPALIFKNFANFFKCSNNFFYDRAVLLGDGLYTEHKGGLMTGHFNVLTENTVVSAQPEIIQLPPQKRKFYITLDGKIIEDLTKILEQRVLFGAKKLYQLIYPNPSEENNCKKNKVFDILPGNHLYDVDSNLESKANFNGDENKAKSWDSPIFNDWKEANVLFLDFNLIYMVCLGYTGQTPEDIYKACIKDNPGYSYLPDLKSQYKYLANLIAKLVEVKFYDHYNWRIIRTHNPLFNPEIDFNTILKFKVKNILCSNSEDKTRLYNLIEIWKVDKLLKRNTNILCEWQDNPQVPIPEIDLLEIFQMSEIDFWLTSHFHASLVVAAPYKRVMNFSKFNKDFINLNFPGKCFDRFNIFFGDKSPNDGSNISYPNNLANSMVDCVNDSQPKIIELLPKGPQNLLIEFVTGNSGRYLDPLKSDYLSNGDIIWARSYGKAYVDSYLENSINNINVNSFTSLDETSKAINNYANNIFTNYNNSFGYAMAYFNKHEVIIEFKEGPNNDLIKKFVIRRTSDITKLYPIEKMLKKIDLPKKKLKK